jgi:CRISPR-associated protein Cas5t
MPRIATTLRKLTRFKYGVGGKEGSKPDFVETLCGIEFLCWIDSSVESSAGQSPTLETRILEALCEPEKVNRYGVLCLGLSDDAVNEVSLCKQAEGRWHRLLPSDIGMIELPVWVNHTGSAGTRWQRYQLESNATELASSPGECSWEWTDMICLP